MKTIKFIICICIAALVVSGKDEADGLSTKSLTELELNQLEKSKTEALRYANWGCIKLAEEKQNEFLERMEAIRIEEIKKIREKNKELKKNVKEELAMHFIQETKVQEVRLSVFIQQRRTDICIWKKQGESILQSIQNTLHEKGIDKTKIIKTICQEFGFSTNQDKKEHLIFYLSNNLEDDSPKIILAYVVNELFLKNKIKINIHFTFDNEKTNIIELDANNDKKQIIWDKSLDFLESLQKIMISFNSHPTGC